MYTHLTITPINRIFPSTQKIASYLYLVNPQSPQTISVLNFSPPSRYNLHITLCKFNKTCWFDTLVYCKMITTIVLVNTLVTSENYHFFFLMGIFTIYSLSNFRVYDTVYRLITLEPQNSFILYLEVYVFWSTSPLVPSPPSPW